MLVDEIKKRLTQAMKDKDTVGRDLLRLTLGELQTAEARENRPLSNEEAVAVLRKLVKSNQETAALTTDEEQSKALAHEIGILSSLLPARLTVDQIVEALAPALEALKGAKNDGQATGIAMKHLKAAGAEVDGKDVTAAVSRLR